MKKGRDWLDYAQLASSVGQNIQLGGIKGSLNDLQSIEAQKQRSETQKQIKAQQLARFRKYLFELEDEYDAIQNARDPQQPKEVLWRILKIQSSLAFLGHYDSITYEDKDRHRALAKRTELVKVETEKNLKPDEITDLNKAIEYRSSLAELQEGIEYKQAVESYKKAVEAAQPAKEAATAKVDELINRDPPLPGKGAQGISPELMLVAIVGSIIVIFAGGAMLSSPTPDSAPDAIGVIFGGAFGLIFFAILLFASPSQEMRQRIADIEKIKKEIAELDAKWPTLKETELYIYTPTEADEKVSAADLTKTYDERVAFIVRVSGSNEIFKVEED